jgi:hypothetical protein
MPSTVLESLTSLINSPPGQLPAGGVLAGIVWGFFERVENVLSENTKLKIAIWLLGMKTAERVQNWPTTFENANCLAPRGFPTYTPPEVCCWL